jgi:hypothetical protein
MRGNAVDANEQKHITGVLGILQITAVDEACGFFAVPLQLHNDCMHTFGGSIL